MTMRVFFRIIISCLCHTLSLTFPMYFVATQTQNTERKNEVPHAAPRSTSKQRSINNTGSSCQESSSNNLIDLLTTDLPDLEGSSSSCRVFTRRCSSDAKHYMNCDMSSLALGSSVPKDPFDMSK